jgi:hypothetical protein
MSLRINQCREKTIFHNRFYPVTFTHIKQVNPMTSHISKLFQIALSTLAIVPLTLNLSPVRAEAPDAIGDITNLTTKIARNPLRTASVEESTDDNSDTETSADREKSIG